MALEAVCKLVVKVAPTVAASVCRGTHSKRRRLAFDVADVAADSAVGGSSAATLSTCRLNRMLHLPHTSTPFATEQQSERGVLIDLRGCDAVAVALRLSQCACLFKHASGAK